MGPKTNKIMLRLDYCGINLLITGSCFPPFVYGFYCQPFFYVIYLSIIGSVSLVVFFVSLFDKIHKPENNGWKSLMYGSLGIFAAFPAIHLGINGFFN